MTEPSASAEWPSSPPRVSVALCTYNGAAFLADQLESIRSQSRVPDEIVICDDQSKDATIAVVQAFRERAAGITVRLEQNPVNLRSTKNFERAVSLCRGDIVFLSDQDDVWRHDKVARILDAFADPAVGMAFSDAVVIDEAGAEVGRKLWESVPFGPGEQAVMQTGAAADVLLRRNVVTGATMAFRARFLPLLLPIPPSWVHDAWFALLIACCAPVACLPETLTLYRVHRGQQIGVDVHRGPVGRGRALLRRRDALRDDLRKSHAQMTLARERLGEAAARGFPLRAGTLASVDEKLVHLRKRFAPRSKAARVMSIATEIANGRYFTYSSGVRSVLRDLAML